MLTTLQGCLLHCLWPAWVCISLGLGHCWEDGCIVLSHMTAVPLDFSPRVLDLCLIVHPQKPTDSRVPQLPPEEYEGWVQHCLGVTYDYWKGSIILCAYKKEYMKFFRQLGVFMAQLMAKVKAVAYGFHLLDQSSAFLLLKDIP